LQYGKVKKLVITQRNLFKKVKIMLDKVFRRKTAI
jgi:hypothetical protein